MNLKYLRGFAASLAVLSFVAPASAWSGGHTGQTRAIVERLPDGLADRLSEGVIERAVADWAKYADNFDPIEADVLSARVRAVLAGYDIEKRYDLHDDAARAVMFALLVDALREDRPDEAAFWVTNLGHAAGDMAATNHDPLVQKIVYHWITKDFDARIADGVPIRPMMDMLDLSWTADDEDGAAVFAETVEAMRLDDDGRDAETAMLEIMMYGHRGAAYMGERTGPMIAASAEYLRTGDAAAEREVHRLASEMGAWAVVRVLRDLQVAQRLADAGVEVRPDAALFERFREIELEFAEQRPMSDSLYTGLNREMPADGRPVIGVVAEPLWRMDRTFLGYNYRPAAAAVARSLGAAGRDYVLLDVRDMLNGGLPDPEAMPIVVVPAQATTSSYLTMDRADLDDAIETYADAGGKVIWAGGRPSDALDAFGDHDDVKRGSFGVEDDKLDRYALRLLDGDDAHAWTMGARPKPTAGWGAAGTGRTFAEADELTPLLRWEGGGEPSTVGVLATEDGQPRHAFLPHWTLWMYLLDDERTIPDPARPTLDPVGSVIFFHTLDRLSGTAAAPAPEAVAAPEPRPAKPEVPLPDLDVTAALPPVVPDGEKLVRGGEPVRYWGVNMNLQPWVTADSVDAAIDRVAAMGFNAIRFWPNRAAFYGVEPADALAPPQGIAFVDAERGDGSLLDLYDRMAARAKRRGVAIYNPALMYYPPYFADFVDVVETTPQDRAGWVGALRDKSVDEVYNLFRVAQFFDERSQAIMLAHATAYLDHTNPYTGIRNADENNFVAWDLSNESRFVWQMLLENEFRGDGRRAFGPYFTAKLRERWNAWLAEKYANDDALRRAWGGLDDGSLGDGTVEPGTASPDGQDYPDARVEDFTAFAVDLVTAWTERFIAHVRSHASDPDNGVAVATLIADTLHVPNLPNYRAATGGTGAAISTYPAPQQFLPGGSRDADAERFPWDPLVTKRHGLRIFDHARPAGMPLVVYETNYNGFGLYDAEYPWIMAGYAAWQDYAGVFWHNFNHPGPSDIPDPYGDEAFAYQEFEIWGDEVYSSALRAAGEAFKRGLLPAAEDPTVITFNTELVTDPDWRRFEQDGADGAAGGLYDLIRNTAYTRGHRIAFAADGPPVDVDGALVGELGGGTRWGAGVTWDWDNGRFVIDRPNVKAFAGFPEGGTITWGDGFAITGLDREFVSVGLVSLDGLPLAESGEVLLSAVSHSYPEGMHLVEDGQARDEAALDVTDLDGVTMAPGDGPVVVERLGFTLTLPPLPGRRAALRDFAMRVLDERDAADALTVPADLPVTDVLLTR